jgi:hypothetical protein
MSAYLGRRGFDELRDKLNERDFAVVRSVSQHRFLSATQIEALHFCGRTPTSRARVCRKSLERLTHERILKRLQRRVGGVRAGSASFVYCVGPVGARLLGETRRTTEPSALFLDHTLAIGDVHVCLRQAERVGEISIAELEVEPACWRRFVGTGGAADIVRPDLYLVTAAGDYEDAWFLEIDRGTESPTAISRKCHAYDRYWRSGQEQHRHGSFPLTVWVCPNDRRARRIERVISATRNLNRNLFRVITQDGLLDLLARGAS